MCKLRIAHLCQICAIKFAICNLIASFLILFTLYKKKVQDLNYFSLTDKNDFLSLRY